MPEGRPFLVRPVGMYDVESNRHFSVWPASSPWNTQAAHARALPSAGRGGRSPDDKSGGDDLFPGGDLRTLQACDCPADGEPSEACDVLSDGGEVDMGQAGQMAVVEPDDGDVAGDRDAGAETRPPTESI